MSISQRQVTSYWRTTGPVLVVMVLLAALLGGCGSGGDGHDDEPAIQTLRFTAEYVNTDQPARPLASFSTGDANLPEGVHRIHDAQELADFSQLLTRDLSELAAFDFGSKDYFLVIHSTPCAALVRREAFVSENLFVYEYRYKPYVDLVCPAVVSLDVSLFEVGPPRGPSVQLTLASSALSMDLAAGDEIEVTVEGAWSGTNVQPAEVYLQLRDFAGRFASPENRSGLSGSAFSFTLHTPPIFAAGTHTGTIEVRSCRDKNCEMPYPGGSATAAYTLNVAAVANWETHQRDAAHRGYVPIWLDPSRFATAWEWSREFDGEPIGGINAVVTANGMVYVTKDVYFGQGVLYALNEADGAEGWRVSFGEVPALNPPAVSNGRVFAAVTGHEATALWAFDAQTGSYLHKSGFEGQWPHVMAPTVYGDQVYTAGGYYGGMSYSFSTDDGSRTWVHDAGGVWDMFTPAADDSYVYHYNGSALFLIDRTTGATSATITDPFGINSGYSYHGAPMIGGRGNVLAFAGGAWSSGGSNAEQQQHRVLSSFDIDLRFFEWATSHAYLTAPAVANGVVYAGRSIPISLDAIDEATGDILWSWTPAGNGDTSFHRNIVVTRNILFASTDKAVYALDLATKTPVWSYPQPGMLAISADRTLYIATGARESDGRLVAVRLK